MSFLGNKYIPDYCLPDLPWYERDDLLTWYDQNKFEEFSKDPDNYLKNKKAINFDMIHAQCRGDKREYSDKIYQTIVIDHVKKKRHEGKKEPLVLVSIQIKRIYMFKKKLSLSHFLDK